MTKLKIFLVIIYLLMQHHVFSNNTSIKWSAEITKENDSVYTINVTGNIEQGWYVYAGNKGAFGLEAAKINWDNENIFIDGNAKTSSNFLIINDKIFKSKLYVYSGKINIKQDVLIKGAVPSKFKLTITGFASNGETFLPIEETTGVELKGVADDNTETKEIKIGSINLNQPQSECGITTNNNDKSLFSTFLLGLIGGLLALLTPCVFPMIPLTISYFAKADEIAKNEKYKQRNIEAAPNPFINVTTNGHEKKQQVNANSLLYGLSIFLIYLFISLPFHLAKNIDPQIFNVISTNVWINLFFFLVFVAFALSLFGLFEIRLPAALATKADAKSGIKNKASIFFMALTLAIVSFSCTGPILGSLLVGSLSGAGGAWQLTAGISGFGFALALPFALFAMFPRWIKYLPKSGGWLDTTKKVLAFVELALAFKFLSNADLVAHWGILKREVFISVWLVISLSLALYLFQFPSFRNQNISAARRIAGIGALLFSVYLFLGLTGSSYANLTLLSGFPPPMSYSIYPKNIGSLSPEPAVVNDYEKAVQLAKDEHKAILIDFTGWACVNCRKMEENVWTDDKVSKLIKRNFILVSLYVDDGKKLPAEKKFYYTTQEGAEKRIETQGDLWATFEAENFKQVTQPLYAVISPDEELLNHPVGYTPDVKEYSQWLECGLKAYKR